MNHLFSSITDSFLSEAFWVLFGSALLFTIQRTSKKFTLWRLRIRINRAIQAQNIKQTSRVTDLATGDPYFKAQHLRARVSCLAGDPRTFRLALPEQLSRILNQNENDFGDESLERAEYITSDLILEPSSLLAENPKIVKGAPNSDSHHKSTRKDTVARLLEKEAELTGILSLRDRIEAARNQVGKEFASRAGGALFNGRKYGIFNIAPARYGEHEEPGADLLLFETDYFTHRVMRTVYRDLIADFRSGRLAGRERSAVREMLDANSNNFLKYRLFLTSVGINTLLICHNGDQREVVLSRRSKQVHNTSSEITQYHVTMNEGLSQTDKDPFGNVSIELCFKRGLREELGIGDDIFSQTLHSAIYDIFLEKEKFEIGFTSSLELPVSYHESIEALIARDKSLEFENFVSIPLSRGRLLDFIRNNERFFIPHGRYTLERVLMREGVFFKASELQPKKSLRK